MTPEQRILDAVRAGHPVTHAMTCDTITTAQELDAYRSGIRGRGALTADAIKAIERRRGELSA